MQPYPSQQEFWGSDWRVGLGRPYNVIEEHMIVKYNLRRTYPARTLLEWEYILKISYDSYLFPAGGRRDRVHPCWWTCQTLVWFGNYRPAQQWTKKTADRIETCIVTLLLVCEKFNASYFASPGVRAEIYMKGRRELEAWAEEQDAGVEPPAKRQRLLS